VQSEAKSQKEVDEKGRIHRIWNRVEVLALCLPVPCWKNDVGLLPVFLLALKLKSMRAQKEICNPKWRNNSLMDEFTSMFWKLLWQEIQDARFVGTKQEAAKLTKHFFRT
jgi:hypothetical protein